VRIKEHIDYPLLQEKRPEKYQMHKYFARKPANVVAEYISTYSKQDEIVLDPFCGSGVTPIEALRLGRKAIAIDLDPVAIFLTRLTCQPADLADLQKAFDQLKGTAKEEINKLYLTRCPKCQSDAITTHTIWQFEGEQSTNAKPLEIWYKCLNPHCNPKGGKSGGKLVEEDDLVKLQQIEETTIPYWYPKTRLYYPDGTLFKEGTHLEGIDSVPSLFTKRNLTALSLLLREIEALPDGVTRDLVKLAFSSTLAQVSRLVIVIERTKAGKLKEKRQAGGWIRPRFWIPAKHFELNVWDSFENRYRAVLKGKEESNEDITDYRQAEETDDLLGGKANILLMNESALTALRKLPDNCVDYVFTDPPYGGAIQYLELSTLWASWLRFDMPFADELTINPAQKKGFDYYHQLLRTIFAEVYRVVKTGRWVTITFHSTDIKVYNSIIRAVSYAGFDLENIVYQPTPASPKASLQPYGSAVGDYYLRFRKPLSVAKLAPEAVEIDKERYERVVVEAVKEMLVKRGEPTLYTDILKGIYMELDKHGFLFIASPEHIQDVIKKQEELVFIEGRGWWLKDPSKYWLHITPLADRLEKAIIQVLRKRQVVSFSEVLKEVFLDFRNAMTPSSASVEEILEAYAEKVPGGLWRMRPSIEQRESEHSLMIGRLAEVGKKVGYKVWIGKPEQAKIYEGKRLAELCTFRDLSSLSLAPDKLDFIENIDLLWLKTDKIAYAFEVENTTVITEAINRCTNIPPEYQTTKCIVIPEERRALLYKKVNSELLKERVAKEGWKFIYYTDLERAFNETKGRKQIQIADFEAIFETTVEPPKVEAQASLPL
jgi:16S rRNA G966 N2-methylase RsmD